MMDSLPIINFEQEAVDQAKSQTFAQRFRAGAELFDCACEVSKSGIRWQNPTFDEEQVMTELRRRIAIGKKIEEMQLHLPESESKS